MSLDIKFYDPADLALGGAKGSLMGSVSGTGDQTVAAGSFFGITSQQEPGSTNYYFRKIYLQNDEAVDVLEPEVYFDDLEYPDQVTFARERSADDVTVDPYSMPTGYETSDFFTAVALEDRIPLNADTSDFTAGADIAIWMRTRAAPGLAADASAIGRLRLRGRRDA